MTIFQFGKLDKKKKKELVKYAKMSPSDHGLDFGMTFLVSSLFGMLSYNLIYIFIRSVHLLRRVIVYAYHASTVCWCVSSSSAGKSHEL